MIGLYLHIPFCRTRCPYCDFVSRAVPGSVPTAYVEALCSEIKQFAGPSHAGSVFIGGGTPSLLSPHDLAAVLEALRTRFVFHDAEVTIEANPDDLTQALADAWAEQGVNRVSLGVQSFDDEVLTYLGRRHDAAGARRACEIIAERFPNWSLDLIFGAHPVSRWERTLAAALEFSPQHLSAYGLTFEEGTPFGERGDEAIGDEAWLDLYRQAHAALSKAGYDHYEVSNFARPPLFCRHNLVYWHNEEYAGFGQAAYSFLGGVRSRNALGLDDYLARPGQKEEALVLSPRETRVETIIQHLRLREGLSWVYYEKRFGEPVEKMFGEAVRRLVARGLVTTGEAGIRPTALGFELNNEIGLELV